MVRAFRQSAIGQIFLGGVVIAIILAFILSGNAGSAGPLDDECAVELGKTCIQPKEFIAAYGLVTSIGINEQAARRLELKKQVARGLVERTVLEAEAERAGIATSEEDVDLELAEGRARVSLPAEGAERLAMNLAMCIDGPMGCEAGTVGLRSLPVKKDGAFDYERYKRIVRNATGRSPGQFKELQAREHTAERMRELIRHGVKVSEEEAFLAFSRARSEATARVAKIETAWFQRFVVRVDEAGLDAWMKSHTAELDALVKEAEGTWAPGCSVVAEIRFDSEADGAKAELEALAKGLRSGADFETAARKSSTAESARHGGLVGCLDARYGLGADVLIAAAEKLAKPGDLSAVVETPLGPTLLRLEARLDAQNRESILRRFHAGRLASGELAEARAKKFGEELISALGSGQAMTEALDALTRGALDGSAFAAKPSEKAGEPATSPALTAKDRPLSDISRPFNVEQSPVPNATLTESLSALVFALPKDDAVLDKVVPTSTGFAVLQLKSKDMVTRERFADDRASIIATLEARKAEEVLARFVDGLIERAGGVKYSASYVPDESKAAATPPGNLPGN